MAIQYYMRGFNTVAPGAVGFVDWIVNDKPDATAIYVPAPFVSGNITNITVNRVVQSKVHNFLQPAESLGGVDGYFFHLNSYDWLHATPPGPPIPVPTKFVGVAAVRGSTDGITPRDYATMVWDEVEQRWKFAFNTNGNHTTLGAYIPINTGTITSDGYLAVGILPALSGVIRIPNNLWIEARRNTIVGDGYLIRLDTTDRVQIGTLAETPIIYMPGNLRVDGYIRDGSTNPSVSGFIRNGNATTILTVRDQTNANDLNILATNSSNNLLIGNATATFSNILYNTSTSAVHQFQTNSASLLEIGTAGGAGGVNNFMRFAIGIVAPTIYQTTQTAGSTTGQTLTLQAQNSTGATSVGGAVQIKSGTGTTAHGTIDFVTGNDGATPPKMRIFPTVDATPANNNSILFSENLFRVDVAQLAPRIRHDDKISPPSSTAEIFTLQAQNNTAATSTGGILNLTSGTGTTIAGVVNLQTGGVSKFTANTTKNTHHNPIEEFDLSQVNPVIRQDAQTANSTNGQILTLQSQNATGTTSTGGALVLTSGTGTTAAGTTDIQTGTVSRMLITAGSPAATTASSLFHINSFQVDTLVPNPIFLQNDRTPASTDGYSFTFQAQNATGTTSVGGDLVLAAGSGTSRDGYVRIRTGLGDRVVITQTQTIINGNLLVNGTTTNINSTVVELADRVIHVNSSAGSYPTLSPAPTNITGFSVDRGTVAGPAKRDYYGLFWYETDGYWRFAANTDGYAPGNETTLSITLPVIASTFLAQPISATTAAAIPTVGGFRALNNTAAVASRNNAATSDLILVSTDATDHLVWGAGTINAGHIFNTTVGTLYDFQVAGASAYTITPVSSGTTTLQAAATVLSVVYKQADLTTNAATAATTTIQAQNETGTTSTGGALNLTTGTGTTNPGNLNLQIGGTTLLTLFNTTGNPNALQWLSTTTGPIFNQGLVSTNGATGAPFTIQAQNATGTTSTGGQLALTSGTGTTTAGNVNIQCGGNTIISAQPTLVALTQTILQYGSAVVAPLFRQSDKVTNAATGETFTVQAQNETGTTSTGGSLNLTSGTGTTTAGNVNLQVGGTTTASVVPNKFVLNKGFRRNITNVATTYPVVVTDDIIAITTLSAPFTITLPTTPTTGDTYTVKDTTGNAGVSTITVSGNGNSIDGNANFLLLQPYAAATFVFINNQWSVI